MQGLEPLAMIMGAARRLPVDGDELVAVRPEGGYPALEAASEQGWMDAVHQVAQSACARNTMVEVGEAPQEVEMMLSPIGDVVEIVAGGDSCAGHQ